MKKLTLRATTVENALASYEAAAGSDDVGTEIDSGLLGCIRDGVGAHIVGCYIAPTAASIALGAIVKLADSALWWFAGVDMDLLTLETVGTSLTSTALSHSPVIMMSISASINWCLYKRWDSEYGSQLRLSYAHQKAHDKKVGIFNSLNTSRGVRLVGFALSAYLSNSSPHNHANLAFPVREMNTTIALPWYKAQPENIKDLMRRNARQLNMRVADCILEVPECTSRFPAPPPPPAICLGGR